MASLMILPREIRDDILERVLLSETQSPRERGREPGQTRITDLEPYRWMFENKPVLSEPQTVQPTASALLLVSRQFHDETLDALRRLPCQGRRHKMEFMLLESRELWLTFTHVPFRCTTLEQVDFTVRLVGTMQDPSRAESPGGIGRHVLGILYALARCLNCGPTRKPPASTTYINDRSITVRHVVLNFVSPADQSLLAGPDDRTAWRAALEHARRSGGRGCHRIPEEADEARVAGLGHGEPF
ncbi:uncharacterized protein PG986_003746 [Apiospora aurea]|uniref:Uncharacterized protein n=1 Tax=Apiospora aurea TaxID=335848 RepID=A0ABR1QU51_9PEZI